MYIYNLTLQNSGAVVSAIYGNFSSAKAQEFVVAKGKRLELLRPDEAGKAQVVLATEAFGCIRSIQAFRLMGATTDYIVIGSDSGRIVIVEYDAARNAFTKLHQETYGMTGCRRIVPGQYVCVDPKGRAIMVGALEKQKMVYVMNRDSSTNRLTISSPLEAHKASMLAFAMCGVDVGYENPKFACIELSYADADQDSSGEAAAEAEKLLTFYELDLGLNHVTRKWSTPVDRGASNLVAVPGGDGEGPGGVLVLAEDWIYYHNEDHDEVAGAAVPRRKNLPGERGTLMVCSATHRQKNLFFFLVQSEYGDIFKVTLDWDADTVANVRIKYFDTIPPTNSMCITKTGLLFAASEFGNHALYQFQGIGDDDDAVESTSVDTINERAEMGGGEGGEGGEGEEGGEGGEVNAREFAPTFMPQVLRNLLMIDEMESLAPLCDMQVEDLCREETPQIYTACGRGSRSSLRILRHGLAVTAMAESELPGNPDKVWTVRKSKESEFDDYIVVTFQNATLVLSIGDTVEEVTDSGFLDTVPTIFVTLLNDGAILQVHAKGIRHIMPDGRKVEWDAPGRKDIVLATANAFQVIIALSGAEVIYFELDESGSLVEKLKMKMDNVDDLIALDVPPVPEGRRRANLLAVTGWDRTVRILSLEPGNLLEKLSTLALPAHATSLALTTVQGSGSGADDAAGGEGKVGGGSSGYGGTAVFLNVGLDNGVLLRTEVDPTSGTLSDQRTRFLGSRKVKLFRSRLQDREVLLALSSRPWLCYYYQDRHLMTPMSYDALEHASSFCSDQCPEGIVAIAGNTLRIITVEKLGEAFNQTTIPLSYTPRRIVVHPETKHVLCIESDHNAFNASEKAELEQMYAAAAAAEDGGGETKAADMEVSAAAGGDDEEEDEEEDVVTEMQTGAPRPPQSGKWASCLRIIDPISEDTLDVAEIEDNEAAMSMATCVFHDRGGEVFVVVGTAQGLTLHPRTVTGSYLRVYRLLDGGRKLQMLHKTPLMGDVPMALAEFQGKILVGLGNTLRLYDMGKRKLLRKCELKGLPTMVTQIHVSGDRIVVGDMAEGFIYIKYHRLENSLTMFADEVHPRFLSAGCMLDHDTMCGGDKFGNIYVTRLQDGVSDDVIDNPTGNQLLWERGANSGAPNKLSCQVVFHVGEVPTVMRKTTLVNGGMEVILYGTIMGSIGALMPFSSREDVDFFSHLEMYMRQEAPPLSGREHLAYRSSFVPVKDCIDGDLCEQYCTLTHAKQVKIADELDRTPNEVIKKIEDLRNRAL